MLNLVLFGPPGAGKGTQAAFLKKTYNLIHLSTGDLLRSRIAEGTALGIEAKQYMDKGELVPDDIVVGMIRNTIKKHPDAKGFVFDGFPRTVPQAIALDEMLSRNNVPIIGMLSLEVEKEELINRLTARAKISDRADDQNQKVIKNRISVYNQKTFPLIEYYKSQNKFYPINGMGTIDDISNRLKEVIDLFKLQ